MNNAKDIAEASVKAILKELVKVLPLGGAALAIFDELNAKQIERKTNRLKEFYNNLYEAVDAVKEMINQEYIRKDDFLDVFEEATRYVVTERQEEKRIYFKNILVNSITSTDCDYDKTERYFRLLDNLTEIELRILAVLDNPARYNEMHGMPVKDPIHNAYQYSTQHVSGSGILTQVLGLKLHDVEDAVTILFSNGLIVSNVLQRQLETNANGIHVLDNLLTSRGKDFVKFVKG